VDFDRSSTRESRVMSAFPARYQWPPTLLSEMIFKNCSTYLILVMRDVEDNVKDRAGERRLSNTGLDSFEHITESVNGMDDAESTFERAHCLTVISHSSWSAHLGHTARVSSTWDGNSLAMDANYFKQKDLLRRVLCERLMSGRR
jgi:hypothetical protein